VTINSKTGILSADHLQVIDTYGRVFQVSVRKITDHSLQLDMGHLSSGMYMIRAKVDDSFRIFRVVKQ